MNGIVKTEYFIKSRNPVPVFSDQWLTESVAGTMDEAMGGWKLLVRRVGNDNVRIERVMTVVVHGPEV